MNRSESEIWKTLWIGVHAHRRCRSLIILVAGFSLISGCGGFGPGAISDDYSFFNHAISKSSNEQLMFNLIRLGSGNPVYCVGVDSMISQFRLASDFEISRRHNNLHGSFGPALNAAFPIRDDPVPDPATETMARGNLLYIQKPTITYRPLEDGEIAQAMLAPISQSTLVRLVQSGWGIERVFSCCVQRINNFSNGRLGDGEGATGPDERFRAVIDLLTILHQSGELRVSEEANGIYLCLPENSKDHRSDLVQLKKLLALPETDQVRVRVVSGLFQHSPDEISIQMRSLSAVLTAITCDCFEWLNNAPNRTLPWLRIHRSLLPRHNAFTQVRAGGHWYYIARDDWRSKRTFAMLSSLFTAAEASLSDD